MRTGSFGSMQDIGTVPAESRLQAMGFAGARFSGGYRRQRRRAVNRLLDSVRERGHDWCSFRESPTSHGPLQVPRQTILSQPTHERDLCRAAVSDLRQHDEWGHRAPSGRDRSDRITTLVVFSTGPLVLLTFTW
jgi:hypothetical protein